MLAGCGGGSSGVDSTDTRLWSQTVSRYLQDPLWNDQNAYDAGNFLMAPLHAAFRYNRTDWQNEIAANLQRFMDSGKAGFTQVRLYQLHYLYLCSRFAVLAARSGKEALITAGLVDYLYTRMDQLWRLDPAGNWDGSTFPGGIRERTLWNIAHANSTLPLSYYRAIEDEDLFTMAIAGDLAAYERITGTTNLRSDVVKDVLAVARQTFETFGVEQPGGGWLFQPGVWTDHPDFAYAGNTAKSANLQPLKKPGIAEDSSHSHQMPLWLTSLAAVDDTGYYQQLLVGLERQLFGKVLLAPTSDYPGWRTTNFMDGWNGIYRWGYDTVGAGNGYGPYELSGTLTLGWWTFLGTSRIRGVYSDMSRRYPVDPRVLATDLGPNPIRNANPLVDDPASYQNGFRELIDRLAALPL